MLFTVELTLLEDMQIKDQNMEKPDIWNFAGLLTVNSIWGCGCGGGGTTPPLTEKKIREKKRQMQSRWFFINFIKILIDNF